MTTDKVNKTTGEITPSLTKISDGMLAEIQTFDDALAVINDVFNGYIVEADKVLGTGFGVADEKAAFIGTAFVILNTDKNVSYRRNDEGELLEFWSLHIVTKDGRKAILNDGGTGIAAQLTELYNRHPELLGKPMLVKRGLRVSNYVHPTAGPSQTFYLDTGGKV